LILAFAMKKSATSKAKAPRVNKKATHEEMEHKMPKMNGTGIATLMTANEADTEAVINATT